MASVELMDFAVVLEEDVSPLVIIIATVTLRSLVSHNFGTRLSFSIVTHVIA